MAPKRNMRVMKKPTCAPRHRGRTGPAYTAFIEAAGSLGTLDVPKIMDVVKRQGHRHAKGRGNQFLKTAFAREDLDEPGEADSAFESALRV